MHRHSHCELRTAICVPARLRGAGGGALFRALRAAATLCFGVRRSGEEHTLRNTRAYAYVKSVHKTRENAQCTECAAEAPREENAHEHDAGLPIARRRRQKSHTRAHRVDDDERYGPHDGDGDAADGAGDDDDGTMFMAAMIIVVDYSVTDTHFR